MKTARFSEVVKRSGRPEVHLTWTVGSDDKVLKSALKQSRVLTVHQNLSGSKKDFGSVGVEAGGDAQFLIFPRSLRRYTGKRIVGIDYDLLEEKLSLGPKVKTPKRASQEQRALKKRQERQPPKPRAKPTNTESREEKKPAPEPIDFESRARDEDPTKIEIRKALADLAGGAISTAKRRLKALLGDFPPPLKRHSRTVSGTDSWRRQSRGD
jgi:hypothetical protein